MKKIALITTNRIFAQSFDSVIKALAQQDFKLSILLNSDQALLDAKIFEINVALIDMGSIDDAYNELKEAETSLSFCLKLKHSLPKCHLLLMVPQNDKLKCQIAVQAKQRKIVDDYVFYDASLKYLLAKIEAF